MKNNQGFSLIGVLVSIVILSIVLLGTMQAMNNMMLMSQTSEQKQNVVSLVSSTAGVAANTATCTAAITQTVNTYGAPLVFNGLSAGVSVDNYRLTVNDVSFQNGTLVQTGYDGTQVYQGTLTMTFKSNISVYGSQVFAPRAVMAIYLTVSPSNIITACGVVMPTLPSAPTIPPVTPPSNPPTADGTQGCSAIGGIYSNGVCTINSNKDHNDDGNCDSH